MEEKSLKELVEEEINSAEERLEAGKILLEKDKLADSVNRIYFSVFHSAKALLHSIGKETKTHSGLVSQFGLYLVKPKKVDKKFGRILRELYEARESSDYVISSVFEREEVEEMYKEAESFLNLAKRKVGEYLKKYEES